MKKINNNYRAMSDKELTKVASDLEIEISKMQVESLVKAPKDTNLKGKKRKELAIVKTLLRQIELGVKNNQA